MPSTEPSSEVRTAGADKPIWTVGFDGSDHSANALRWAIRRAAERGAALDIVSAWMYPHNDRIPPDSPFSAEEIYGEFGIDCRRRARIGPAASVLVDSAEEAELLVTGTRGRGALTSLVLGSVTHDLVTHLHTPTVVVPDSHDAASPVRHAVVGVNRSGASRASLRWAAAFAGDDAIITGVHAHTEHIDERDDVETMLRAVEDDLGRPGRFRRAFSNESAGRAVLAEATDVAADLIVVGSDREPGFETEVASTALWLLQHLDRPLAVIPRSAR